MPRHDTDTLLGVIAELLGLLKESKRNHNHCDDSWYCCRACRHPDHMLAEGENIGSGFSFKPGVCSCGASEWNAKVDEFRHC